MLLTVLVFGPLVVMLAAKAAKAFNTEGGRVADKIELNTRAAALGAQKCYPRVIPVAPVDDMNHVDVIRRIECDTALSRQEKDQYQAAVARRVVLDNHLATGGV